MGTLTKSLLFMAREVNRGFWRGKCRQMSLSVKPITPLTIDEAKALCVCMVAPAAPKSYGLKETMVPQGDNVLPVCKDQKELLAKNMKDSYQEVIIPLGSDLGVRERYVSFWKGLRFGRLLEDLDSLAVLISYIHMSDPKRMHMKSPYANVTALVDRIDWHENAYKLSSNQDVKLCGQVTWVGKSSMEITMIVEQEVDGRPVKMLTARFLMVARNPATGGAGVVNPLVPDGELESSLFELGQKNKLSRQEKSRTSLLKTPPNEEERILVHDLFRETIDEESGTFSIRVKPDNAVWMSDLKLKNIGICHPEERNLYGKIFGGYLMRQAYELAWADASLFCKTRPVPCVVDDIIFQQPVEVGALLLFLSQIIYTEGSLMVLRVHAKVQDISTGSHKTTNHFYFLFDSTNPNLPRVVPRTYAEAMLYLDGMRHLRDSRASAQ